MALERDWLSGGYVPAGGRGGFLPRVVDDDLRDTVAVAQIRKGKMVLVTGGLHPAAEGHGLVYMRLIKVATVMASHNFIPV